MFVQITDLGILDESEAMNPKSLEPKNFIVESKSPEVYPEPEGTPPLMPIEPLEQ